MPRGGTLLLGAQVDSADQERVVIAVTDTGAGMDAATLAQVFEPFFTTKGLDGTGLGLSMVQGFAVQSGGEVRIESAPGKGTTVMLWLPVAQMANNSREQQSVPARLRGSGRLLLVDDVVDVLVTASAFLERAGFQVVQAGSGDQALAVLAAGERFDALVTDYAMPGLNGVELIEQARTLQPGLAVLLITGFAEVGGADTLPRAVAVLRKPFQRRELVAALLQVMGREPAGQVAGSGQDATVQQVLGGE
jgi:CheY-like chemotaxis protein